MRVLLGLAAALWLTACATTQTPPAPVDNTPPPIAAPAPEPDIPYVIPVDPTPPATEPAPTLPSIPPTPSGNSVFNQLPYWGTSDMRPALTAFKRSCDHWSGRSPNERISDYQPEYGYVKDWLESCRAAEATADKPGAARRFFESNFYPLLIGAHPEKTGLITGYFQPEIEARKRPDLVFSEPVLEVPARESDRRLPRADIGRAQTRVIAYGRPLEVFFMQIQGSGHIRFKDGRTIRAAYAGNNGFPYTSIGGVLIRRGEVTKDQSGKRDLEAWMRKAGPKAARDLMNENARYIFFTEQKIEPGEGPMGAMRVPLTGMGSMAVDPRYHPYGALMWLQVKMPQKAGDYKGKEQGLLLSAQDTGKAIVGAMRGDIYFGSGDAAGAKAGVMKHNGQWTLLLPRALAERLLAERCIS